MKGSMIDFGTTVDSYKADGLGMVVAVTGVTDEVGTTGRIKRRMKGSQVLLKGVMGEMNLTETARTAVCATNIAVR